MLLSSASFASDQSFDDCSQSLETSTREGKVFVTSKCREVLDDIFTKLNNSRLSTPISQESPSFVSNENDQWALDITSFLPTVLRENNFFKDHHYKEEVNCWGTALASVGIVSDLIHVDSVEFDFWLKSPLCKKVDTPSAGSIGAIKHLDGSHNHAFIYLADNLRYSKQGPGQPFRFETSQTPYGWTTKGSLLDYYNCISFEEYLTSSSHSQNLLSIKSSVDATANIIADYMKSGKYSKSLDDLYTGKIDEKLNNLEEQNQPGHCPKENDHELIDIISARINNFKTVVRFIQYWGIKLEKDHYFGYDSYLYGLLKRQVRKHEGSLNINSKLRKKLLANMGIRFDEENESEDEVLIIYVNTFDLSTEEKKIALNLAMRFSAPNTTFKVKEVRFASDQYFDSKSI